MGQQKAIDLAQNAMKEGHAFYREGRIADSYAAWKIALSLLDLLCSSEEALDVYDTELTKFGQPHMADRPELDKYHADLVMYRGNALYSLGRLEEMLVAYEGALSLYALPHLADRSELDEHRADLYMKRGVSLYSLGRHEEALEAYELAVTLHILPHLANNPKLDIDRALLQVNRGVSLNSLYRFDEALVAYDAALSLYAMPHLADRPGCDADRADLQLNLGVLLCSLSRFDEALEAFDMALRLYNLSHNLDLQELDVKRAYVLNNRIITLNSLGRYEEALEAYELAMTLHILPHLAARPELDAARARLQMNRGTVLKSLGRHEEALEACESGLALLNQPHLVDRPELDKDRADLLMNKGTDLTSLGQLDKALEIYNEALTLYTQSHLEGRQELDVNRLDLLANMVRTLFSLGQMNAILKVFQSALPLYTQPDYVDRPELDKGRARLQMTRGNALGSLDRYEEALDAYEAALFLYALPHLSGCAELDNERANLQMNRGMSLRTLDRHEEALDAYDMALSLYALPHLANRSELDSGRAWLYANMVNLLPEMPDRDGFTDQASNQLAAMLELAPLPVKKKFDPYKEIREDFVHFHSCWLQHAIEQGWEDDIPRIMATIQGRDLAARMLDELENPEGGAVAPGVVQRYQQARLSLRKLRARIDKITSGGLDISPGDDDRGSRLLQSAPISKNQDIPNPELDRLREQYKAQHRELHKLRQAAAEEPGYGVLAQPHRQITLDGLQSSLSENETLVLLLDTGEKPKETEAGDSISEHSGTEQAQSFHALVIRSTGQRLITLPELGQALKQMDCYLASQGRKVAGMTQQKSGRSMVSYRRGAAMDEETHSRATSGFTAGKQRLGDKSYKAFWQAQAECQAKHLWEPLSEALEGITTVITLSHGRLHGLPLEAGLPADKRLRSYPGVVFYAGRRGLLGDALKPAKVSNVAESPAQPLGVLAYPGEGGKKIPRVEDEVQWVWQLYNQSKPLRHYPLQTLAPAVECLHIASHGVPDKRGQVALQVGKNETLDMGRILEQQIRAETVYLGCCLAGQTVEDLDGEPTGLITGFFLRGTKVLHGAVVEVNDEWAPLLGILYQRELHAGKAPEVAMERAKEILGSGEWEPEEFGDLAPKIEALYQKRRIPPEPILGDLLYGMRTFGEG